MFDLMEKRQEKATFFLSKISNVRNEIKSARLELETAKNNYKAVCYELNVTSGWHFIKRRRLEREKREKMDALTLANSEALIQNFKIMGYMVEMVFLCFCMPMDLLQKVGRWVWSGFAERDEIINGQERRLIGLTKVVCSEVKNTQKKGSIGRGIVRLIIVILITSGISFGICEFVYKRNLSKSESAAEKSLEESNIEPSYENVVGK